MIHNPNLVLNKNHCAVIFCAGYGTRLNGFMNPYDNKPLIKTGGKYLIQILLEQLELSKAFSKVIVIGRKQIESKIKNLLSETIKSIPYVYINNEPFTKARQNLIIVKNLVRDQDFFLFHGHAPIPAAHIQTVCLLHTGDRCLVTTLYPHKFKRAKFTFGEEPHIINKITNYGEQSFDKIASPYYGMDAPFLLNSRILETMLKDNLVYWYSHYYQKLQTKKWTIKGVISDFPPEADTKDELLNTLKYVSRSFL